MCSVCVSNRGRVEFSSETVSTISLGVYRGAIISKPIITGYI